MATRFEFVLYGDDVVRLRAAGEEAIAEIERLHDRLSLIRPQSLVSRVNRGAAESPVRLPGDLFHLLLRAEEISSITGGAFDVTVGPLLDLWGFRGDAVRVPGRNEVSACLEHLGMACVQLDRQRRSVSFSCEHLQIDLGGIAKGHALDTAAAILIDAGIRSGILHGGTSTVRAIGSDPSGERWKVAVRSPYAADDTELVGVVALADEAMSVSAVSGRSFEFEGVTYGHVIDPRTGYPVAGVELAVVVLPNATDADALSTALLVLGEDGLNILDRNVVGYRAGILPAQSERSPVTRGTVFIDSRRDSDVTN
jgi:thiamine biosynthesis lipoprotein